MYSVDNATGSVAVTQPGSRRLVLPPGLALGAVGVLAFSFSLPATKLAVADLDPWFVAFGRAAIAGLLALVVLGAGRAPQPTARQWRSLAIVAGGVVVGFPLLTSLALQTVPSGHGAVIIGVLPAMTAVAAVTRTAERPSLRFWLAALAGLVAVVVFAAARGAGGVSLGDLYLVAGVVVCGFGYAEGGALSRELGGARTICWALVLALPLCLIVAVASATSSGLAHVGADAWLGLAYVSLFSMFLGFFAWYAGLARGGIAQIGQVQLAQPVLTLGWAALVLGEHVGVADLATALVVLGCVVATQKARA
jgi:drug/metabolite transporter (DMT)-like permease